MTQATAGMRPHGLMRFSTSGLPTPQRIALWEQHNARALVGLEARTLTGDPLEATELNLNLPRLQLAQVAGNPHLVERTARNITESPAEAVVAYFALEGECFFYHRGGCETLRPGQAILVDADQPFLRGFSHGLRELALKVPRRTLSEITGRSGLSKPLTFSFADTQSGSAHAGALVGLLGRAMAGQATDWDALEESGLALVRQLLGEDSGPAGHLAAAHAVIDRNLGDPQLAARRIAAAVGVSERQLSRIFSAAGTSVPQAILAARLDEARRRITDPAAAASPLADISGRLGFASQPHFSRTYKERFGVSPAQDRRNNGAR